MQLPQYLTFIDLHDLFVHGDLVSDTFNQIPDEEVPENISSE